MSQFLRDDETLRPWFVHLAAVLLLAGTALLPVLALPAGIALAVSNGWLGWNLLQVTRRYRRCVASVEDSRAAAAAERNGPGDAAA